MSLPCASADALSRARALPEEARAAPARRCDLHPQSAGSVPGPTPSFSAAAACARCSISCARGSLRPAAPVRSAKSRPILRIPCTGPGAVALPEAPRRDPWSFPLHRPGSRTANRGGLSGRQYPQQKGRYLVTRLEGVTRLCGPATALSSDCPRNPPGKVGERVPGHDRGKDAPSGRSPVCKAVTISSASPHPSRCPCRA